MSDIPRPVLRWHGGKWLLAPWIIAHFPPHRIYVEPFGGAASVLLRKPRAFAEVYNDLDGEVVNLFRVLRSEESCALIQALRLTPFAREEFADAYVKTDDPVERARRLVIRSFMGFGSTSAMGRSSGFRANSNRSGTTPAHDWRNHVEVLPQIIERLRGVTIEHRRSIDVMRQHDGPNTLHYVDPPYVHGTRAGNGDGRPKHRYAFELDHDDHAELLACLCALQGMVVLSGYSNALYEAGLPGWFRSEKKALADGARARTEVLWINAAARRLFDGTKSLFEVKT